jgi:hypothetical protein
MTALLKLELAELRRADRSCFEQLKYQVQVARQEAAEDRLKLILVIGTQTRQIAAKQSLQRYEGIEYIVSTCDKLLDSDATVAVVAVVVGVLLT